MFELLTPTAATLKSIAPRTEFHGDEHIVAISMRVEIEGANTLLDALSPKLRHALYTSAPGQDDLPGVDPSTPLLRFNAFESHALKACFEGWTLAVDHGIDEHDPITLGGVKVDGFRIVAKEGGTVQMSFRMGSNDISAEEIGLLCGKLGSEISVTLRAPEKKPEEIDASSSAKDLPPSAEDLFAAEHGAEAQDGPQERADEDGEWQGSGDGSDGPSEAPEDPGIYDRARSRTARGREKTKAALAAREGAAE